MNQNTITRKLIYVAILIAMLIPLYLLGQPSSGGNDPGGQLSAMRLKYNIAESKLGELNPSSETMKLASLGLRGVAATLLSEKAERYQIEHEWDRHRATVNNIVLLQPHFEKVWEHQAHNLTYNISKEFDDYRQRYEMIREGSEFLIGGVRQNRTAPRLVWFTGWFYGAKIGMSDEKRQFRRLFREDEVGHENLLEEGIQVDSPEARGPDGNPDNWLVGRLWLNEGYDLVDSGVAINRQTPLNFYETGPKWRIKHAESIEDEGVLDESAVTAWQLGAQDWNDFGNRSIPTTSPFTIKLDQLENLKRERLEKIERIRDLTPEAYQAAYDRLYASLSDDVRQRYEAPREGVGFVEQELMEKVGESLIPNLSDLVSTVAPAQRLKVVALIDEVEDLEERISKTRGYRDQINYAYWKTLAQAEQEERTVRARRLIFEAEAANAQANLEKAIELYEEAFGIWADVFEAYPILTVDDTAEDLFKSVRRYMVAIDSEELPEDFPLRTFVELMGEYGQVPPNMYAEVLAVSAEKTRQRKEELAAQERAREAEIADDASQGEQPPKQPMQDPPQRLDELVKPVDSKDAASAASDADGGMRPVAANQDEDQSNVEQPKQGLDSLSEVEEITPGKAKD